MGVAWQVMTREPAQAGNRASRTEHYLQWWENSPEWEAEVSAVEKRHNSGLFFFLSFSRLWLSFLDGLRPNRSLHTRMLSLCSTNNKFAGGHTASNAPELFRPPQLSGAGPG